MKITLKYQQSCKIVIKKVIIKTQNNISVSLDNVYFKEKHQTEEMSME